jgi:ketosteroid isomerase-like protein
MASANLDLVRSICAAWERGDFRSAEWAHPEIEFVRADRPERGSSMGVDGMAEGWRDFLGAWDELRVDPDEYRELDAERVLVLCHWSGRGKTSGLELGEVRTRSASIFHVRGGKVTRLVLYVEAERGARRPWPHSRDGTFALVGGAGRAASR